MKHLTIALVAAAALSVHAAETEKNAELVEQKAPIFWGFANYGIYSGYQLYGSIVNTEPTLQGYAELNANLPFKLGPIEDLGYLGVGLWNNSDLTGKRNASLRRAFNEFDPNIHWGKTFWFDDDRTIGLTYRTSVVWYFYPHTGNNRPNTKTAFDWNHYLEVTNPYLTPYINIVHEYANSHGNVLQFGVKKPFQITDQFSVCPFLEFVYRSSHYGWCFSHYGQTLDWEKINSGFATMKLELDATYMFNDWIGVFAKVAYCQTLDPNLRQVANQMGMTGYPYYSGNFAGDEYGRWNEFCWGGVGVCVSF